MSIENQAPQGARWTQILPRRLALLGAVLGCAAALFLGGFRAMNWDKPWDAETVAGALAFTAVYLAPFALSLWALRWPAGSARTAAWAGAALLAFAGTITSFSGLTFSLLPAAACLALAALVALLQDGWRRLPITLALAALTVGVGVASFSVMMFGEDERCWQRYQVEETGEWSDWEPENSEGHGRVVSSGSESLCTSNAIAWHESGLVFALLAAAGLVAGRGRRED